MTGLDKILENIASDAKQQADEIIEAAKLEAIKGGAKKDE